MLLSGIPRLLLRLRQRKKNFGKSFSVALFCKCIIEVAAGFLGDSGVIISGRELILSPLCLMQHCGEIPWEGLPSNAEWAAINSRRGCFCFWLSDSVSGVVFIGCIISGSPCSP